jgi:NTE family protein
LKPESFQKVEGAYLYDHEELRRQVALADGGVYDNMGVEPIWKRCGTLLVSDAGGSPSMQFGPKPLWHNQLERAYSLTIEQDRDLRRRVIAQDFKEEKARGAYWLISWPIERFPVEGALKVNQEWADRLGSIRTRLDPFTDEDQRRLINWGYALADAAVRKWLEPSPLKPGWPFPEWSLERG